VIFLFATSALRFVVVPSSARNVNPGLECESGVLTTGVLTERIEIVGEVGVIVNQQIGVADSLSRTSP
jgi:hypothetical protein